MKKEKPNVSVITLTYNQADYIRECIEGILMQKTDFPIELIIHDDASTDGTSDIIKEYAEKYPDIIKPIIQKENQYSQKKSFYPILGKCIDKASGKYIAFCEGDDYWTDPQKLQKQVEFLESHPDIVYTCHRYLTQYDKDEQKELFPNKFLDKYKNAVGFEFDLQYVFKYDWVTKTLTAVFRADKLKNDNLRDSSFYCDTHRVYHLLSQGNGYCFNFVGGVYRKQAGGIWSQEKTLKKLHTEVKKWEDIYKKLPSKFNKQKFRRFYTLYIHESIKNRKMFHVENLSQLKLLFQTPADYINLRKEHKHQNELDRIKNFKLNQD